MSIVRRIKREARTNPAKAAVLVGLLGVALYFWAPLVAGWLGGSEESPSAAARSERDPEQPGQRGSAPPASTTENDSKARPTWNELRQWREKSPWTGPADLALIRDPFHMVPGSQEPSDRMEETEETPIATPEQVVNGLNIQLTGTIVGPGRRVAILDGRAYREGDTVLVENLGRTWELEIRRIGANRVTLGWQSIERELTAPERPQVGRIELVGHSR